MEREIWGENKVKTLNQTTMANGGPWRVEKVVPHGLLFDISSRLPVKTLLRVRCLSKFWGDRLPRVVGFGYVASKKEYKVLRSFYGTGLSLGWETVTIRCDESDSSSRRMTWRELRDDSPCANKGSTRHKPVFANGSLRWNPDSVDSMVASF